MFRWIEPVGEHALRRADMAWRIMLYPVIGTGFFLIVIGPNRGAMSWITIALFVLTAPVMIALFVRAKYYIRRADRLAAEVAERARAEAARDEGDTPPA